MTHEELIREVMQLSLKQRMELLETISRSVSEEIQPREQRGSVVSRLRGIAKPDGQPLSDEAVPLSQRLYGILKFDGDPPTDEELKNHYADYLLEKYS